MSCTWKNRVILAAFWDKISTFHLGQLETEHSLVRNDSPLCSLHHALISFIWSSTTWWTLETRLNWLNNLVSPPYVLSFAGSVPWQVSHPATYCVLQSLTWYRLVVHMCSHFCMSVCCRHMLREAARATACSLTVSTFWLCSSQLDSLRAPACFYCLYIVWSWLENAGKAILTIGKCMLIMLQNKMVLYTSKIAFFHISVWLNGQGGWKFCSRPWFNSWQFAAQTKKVALGKK